MGTCVGRDKLKICNEPCGVRLGEIANPVPGQEITMRLRRTMWGRLSGATEASRIGIGVLAVVAAAALSGCGNNAVLKSNVVGGPNG
jgi:hypothetical protein